MAGKGSGEIDRTKLLAAMTEVFSAGDLRTLCFELGLDYDDLPDGGRQDKARELILYCQRHGRLDEFLSLCRQKRPRVDWDAISQPPPPPPAGEEPPVVVHEEGADIFLSYSRKDSSMKDRLARDLRQAGLSVWTDDGLVPGTPSWKQAIESQIEMAGCLVVLLSPDAKKSVWVRRELDYGVAQGKRIFPAMIRGTATDAIPITVIDHQFVDLRREYERNLSRLCDALKRHLGQPPVAALEPEPVAPEPEAPARSAASGMPAILIAPPKDVSIPHIVTGAPLLNVEWCWVPPGPFTMGSDANDSEKPVHTLDLAGFWLARYPVTNAQYRHFVAAGGYEERRWWSDAGWRWRQVESIEQPRYWTGDKWNDARQPVVGVSWYEADAFARWAAEATGEPIRLPTEAQWEKAARGTDSRTYPWGDNETTDKLCNFDRNVGKTTPVGQYSPAGDGPYGNADLAGNVWEWTSSLFKPYPYDAGDGREDQVAKGRRILRGGSFSASQGYMRTSVRLNYSFDSYGRRSSLGFRLVAHVGSGS